MLVRRFQLPNHAHNRHEWLIACQELTKFIYLFFIYLGTKINVTE